MPKCSATQYNAFKWQAQFDKRGKRYQQKTNMRCTQKETQAGGRRYLNITIIHGIFGAASSIRVPLSVSVLPAVGGM